MKMCLTACLCAHHRFLSGVTSDPEKASALDFKDATTLRFGQNNVVFDLFIETRFLRLIALLSNFSKPFKLFRYYWTKII